MNGAYVTLVRPEDEISTIMTRRYQEDVRGFRKIEWVPNHIIFHMKDDTLIAFHADRVFEVVTYKEED